MSEPNKAGFARLNGAVKHHIVNTLVWRSLRPVQDRAIGPILDGHNAVLLAPTAGGKTEAAFFPVLSKMLDEGWRGLSVLYLSPIRALLNNQQERLEKLAGMVGRSAALWHGDVGSTARKRIRQAPPDILLTTPESLEAMLISTRTEQAQLFRWLRCVVIDEVHAFAGDDRGWHLLSVLDRLSHYADHDLQRIGLSATVGNKEEIVRWLSAGSERTQSTIDPPPDGASAETPGPDVTLDWVGSLENAATIIATLHRGEKRLVFCDSRLIAEKLARLLRLNKIDTWVSHSSLSADQRRQTERAFSERRVGVIVATSALELGIDIGDLDRVIQIDAPMSVASMLQRMGRTGRRPGTQANLLYLAITDEGLIRAAALLEMWKRGYVEPARAPRYPWHVVAQQLMALSLERAGLPRRELADAVETLCRAASLPVERVDEIVEYLVRTERLYEEGGRIAMGLRGEHELGHRHFMKLVSVFTSPPVFTVYWGVREIGSVHQSTFAANPTQTVLLLAGRTWRVTAVAWSKKIAYVEPFEGVGKSRWAGSAAPESEELAQAHRTVLAGEVIAQEHWSHRARARIDELRLAYDEIEPEGETIVSDASAGQIYLYTFAGHRTNVRLAETLRSRGWSAVVPHSLFVRGEPPPVGGGSPGGGAGEAGGATDEDGSWGMDAASAALSVLRQRAFVPVELRDDDPRLRELKFHELLPKWALREVLGER